MEINLETSICSKQALKWFSEVVENLGINNNKKYKSQEVSKKL